MNHHMSRRFLSAIGPALQPGPSCKGTIESNRGGHRKLGVSSMTLEIGTRLGHYRIIYAAGPWRHGGRLPGQKRAPGPGSGAEGLAAEFARDPERSERFQRAVERRPGSAIPTSSPCSNSDMSMATTSTLRSWCRAGI